MISEDSLTELKFVSTGTDVRVSYTARTTSGDMATTGHVVWNTAEDGYRRSDHKILTIKEDGRDRWLSIHDSGDEVTVHTSVDGDDLNPETPDELGRTIGDDAVVEVDLDPIVTRLMGLTSGVSESVSDEIRSYTQFMREHEAYNSWDDLMFQIEVDIADASSERDVDWLYAIALIADSFGNEQIAEQAREEIAEIREDEEPDSDPSEDIAGYLDEHGGVENVTVESDSRITFDLKTHALGTDEQADILNAVRSAGLKPSLVTHMDQWTYMAKKCDDGGDGNGDGDEDDRRRLMTDGGQDRTGENDGLETEVVELWDLSDGDEILFGNRRVPLKVDGEPQEAPIGVRTHVDVQGPRGGEYRLVFKETSFSGSRSSKPYRYYPIGDDGSSTKYVDEIRRVVKGESDE